MDFVYKKANLADLEKIWDKKSIKAINVGLNGKRR